MKRLLLRTPVLWAGVFLWWGCTPDGGTTEAGSSREETHQLSGEAFGTTWNVTWLGEAPSEALARAEIDAVLHAADRQMSTWRSDSELEAVRRGSGAVVVSEATADVVRAALELASQTGGAFDPTVQPLMEFWGFHGTPRASWPTEDAIDTARQGIGWQKVVLARDVEARPTVDAGGTALDLSAIAKGDAVDRVSLVLSQLGAADHLVEIGGEVVARGHNPRGTAWTLGVDLPVSKGREGYAAHVRLTNHGLATSGNYRNVRRVGDRVVGHSIDPRTGVPTQTDVVSASVVAPDCRTADGWATALMVLGADEGLALLASEPDVHAWLMVQDEEGAVTSRGSERASRFFVPVR